MLHWLRTKIKESQRDVDLSVRLRGDTDIDMGEQIASARLAAFREVVDELTRRHRLPAIEEELES